MQTATLPNEIIELIIDELAGETRTLKSWALVSHSSWKSARRQLFSEIKLDSAARCILFSELLKQSPQLASYTRCLILAHGDPTWPPTVSSVFDVEVDILIYVIDRAFPSLRQLKIWFDHPSSRQAKSFNDLPVELLNTFIKLFESPNLSWLEFHRLHALSPVYLTSRSRVNKLVLDVAFDTQHKLLESPPGLPSINGDLCELDSLTVTCSHCAQDIFRDFPLGNLKALELGWMSGGACITFIRTIQSSLRSLVLTDLEDSVVNYLDDLDLRGLEHISLVYRFGELLVEGQFTFLLSLLEMGGSSTVSYALKDITLTINAECFYDLVDRKDLWGRLEVVLNQARYSQLQKVWINSVTMQIRFGFYDNWANVQDLRRLFAHLPSLRATGKLELYYDEDELGSDADNNMDSH